ncbi:MAG: 4-hydroxythreonine-4-phosphate dehydrogenase PdxA [Bacteriovoracaceae bacterium]
MNSKIRVTQGHEKGIGLEIFLKSYSLLGEVQQKSFLLYSQESTLSKYLKDCSINHRFENGELHFWNQKIALKECSSNSKTQTTNSLNEAIKDIKEQDILITLPSSKDQILLDGESTGGHTDFLRKKFKLDSLSMCFVNDAETIILISDHIPLKEVTQISSTQIAHKISTTLSSLDKLQKSLKKVVVAGINPHAGEHGLIGNEDSVIEEAISELKNKRKATEFVGPISGDALHLYDSKEYLKVYLYHDQGLSYYKGLYQSFGLNITLGLPFLRMSVDHGTAFGLYGKNKANYQGCLYQLKEALRIQRNLNEK